MKRLMIFHLLCAPMICSAVQTNPEFYLDSRIDPANGRHKTFAAVLELLAARQVKTIVETGTERWQEARYCFDGDGGSTIIFAHWATENQVQMCSVDINETHIRYCRENTLPYSKNLNLVLGDSVAFLQSFPEIIFSLLG